MSRLFTTNDLKASLKRGAPTDKFRVSISVPSIVTSLLTLPNPNNYEVLAHQVTLPGFSQNSVTAYIRGQKISLRASNDFDSQQLSVTTYLDAQHSFKVLNETWMKAIDTFGSSIVGSYFASAFGSSNSLLSILSKLTGNALMNFQQGYLSTITVTQERSDGLSPSISHIYHHAHPVRTSDVTYDAKSPNQLASITVDYKFAYSSSSFSKL